MKKVLILGAGLVAQPIIHYLLRNGFYVTVASNTPEHGEQMIAGFENAKNINWSIKEEAVLDKLLLENDFVVSLLPYVFHITVAKQALRHKKNMVTTSYVNPEMQALDKEAKDAGIIILNEMGLDPGIDHMSAMKIIDKVHQGNGKIEEFYSICGALPAPECADNPFKYKFSWSPKGVVMAGNNDGRFFKDGKIVDINTKDLFKNPMKVDFPKVGQLEVYPNRDSIAYIDIYGILETKTMYRGTFRYKGWCETLDVMKQLDLITYDKMDMTGMTYAGLLASRIGASGSDQIKNKVADYLKIPVDSYSLNAIEWLGMFENKPMNRKEDTPFEVTSDLLIEKLALGRNERDMIIMQHTFIASYPDGKRKKILSRMLDFGTPATDTAIARTVALPAAIGVKLILENKINIKGVYRPVLPEIYEPVLHELEQMNIRFEEEEENLR
ncbi:MAG: saccharopine dehydrogenase NADP-binding domain-containing protein [Bacteroidia bacterium]|nr:saccharopine dehydrogenase NADP-binding domain-containing protein [Bacteroidia bacterium]